MENEKARGQFAVNPTERRESKLWPVVHKQWRRKGFLVDGRYWIKGVAYGERLYFKFRADAEATAKKLREDRLNNGLMAGTMSLEDRIDAMKAKERLMDFAVSLDDCAKFYVEAQAVRSAALNVPTLAEACDKYYDMKWQEVMRGDLKKSTAHAIKSYSKLIKEQLGALRVNEVTLKVAQNWINDMDRPPKSKKHYRGTLSGVLNWSIVQEWRKDNPCSLVKIGRGRHSKEVAIFTPEEAEELIKASASHPRILAYHALGLYGGLRPEEAQQLIWENVDFEAGEIHVKADTSKVGKKKGNRFVPINEKLRRILEPLKGSGLIVGDNFAKEWDEVRAKAGYTPKPGGKEWPDNVLRHSYATYWLTLHKNMAHLERDMGTSKSMIEKNYHRPIPKAEAVKYWA